MIDAIKVLQKAVKVGDQTKITAAATALQSDAVQTSSADVQQRVRDVCHTPLTL